MWTRYAMAVLSLGLWACAPATQEEELAWEEGRAEQELVQQVGPLQQARYQHTSTRLLDGRVLYAGGGQGSSATPLASAELYNPATGTTSLVAPMNTARRSHSAVLLQDGSVLVIGGVAAAGSSSSVERYVPSTNTWTVMSPMPRASARHSATLLADGRVLVAGGSGYATSTYLFNPTTNTWATTGSLALGRSYSASVRLADNRVLMIGGFTARTEDRVTVELYDPSTGTWSTRASMPDSNGSPSAILLPSGRVLLNGAGSYTVEYDVATDTWSQQRWFTHGHHSGNLVLVDGAPMAFGGMWGEQNFERFNSGLQQWEVVGQLSVARQEYVVDVLADNSVVIAGGAQTNTYLSYTTMDKFTGTFTCTPLTCTAAGAQCGSLADGCGGTIQCGTCGSGYACNSTNRCEQVFAFSFTPTVSSRTVAKGGWATYPINTSGTGTINFSISGLPPGSGAYFGSWSVPAGSSTFLQVQTMEAYAEAGTYTLTITGSDGTTTRTANVTLRVTASPGPDPIINGGFESGSLSGWTSTGTVSVGPSARSGSFTAVLGSTSTPVEGDSTLSQTFTVPASGGLLRYWFYGHALDAPSDYAAVLLRDNTTGITTPLIEHTYARPPYQEWLNAYEDLTPYAGRSVTLTFVNHEAGWGSPTYTYFDDVSLLVPEDFSVSLSPASRSVQSGGSVTYTVNTSGQGTLSLSAIGLPAGATATFSPGTVTAGQSATLTVSTSTSTVEGSYGFTVRGTNTSTQVVSSTAAQLSVTRPLPPTSGSFSYSATNTSSAQQYTTNYSVVLNAGQTLKVGTCTVAGASGTGDTYLRVYGASGSQVAYNDDSCSLLSYLSYTATQSGTYQIRAGCYSSGSCSGTVAYTIQ